VSIFNSQGEWITTLCGNLPPQSPLNLDLTVSNFTATASAPGGSLTLTLNGKVMVVWNATDSKGKVVPNGFYHLVITQALTDGTQIALNRGVYVNPYSQKAQIQLVAYPNLVTSNATVQITAMLEGSPADGTGLVRVYALNGERVKTLDVVNGQAAWDLTNEEGQQVGSGLYFIGFDVMDPKTGADAHKIVKVVVLR
jgi:flagellar hook assembly protein FlgD